MDPDVEGRELKADDQRYQDSATRLAERLLRSLSAIDRELFRKVGLRRAKRRSRWTGRMRRRLALSRHYPRSNAVGDCPWSRDALVPVAGTVAAISPDGLRAGRLQPRPVPKILHFLSTAKVFPRTGRGKTFELKEPVRLRART